jgi:hypothetical protein
LLESRIILRFHGWELSLSLSLSCLRLQPRQHSIEPSTAALDSRDPSPCQ